MRHSVLAHALGVLTMLPTVQWCGPSWADMRIECYLPCAVACATSDACDAPDASEPSGCDSDGASPCTPSACGPDPDDGADTAAGDRAWCPKGPWGGLDAAQAWVDDGVPALVADLAPLDPPIVRSASPALGARAVPPRERASPPPPIRGPPLS